uniref:Uncharacterized protein n=1 Tax=Anguilla anguilla TaxID=7936 RepID=A0A0E9V3P0_ANGAN
MSQPCLDYELLNKTTV